ncbi:MAG: ABC transporter permease [Saprospiraceae bacterium]|nr:ABC transporter permease [Saprospiraceae bacterium]
MTSIISACTAEWIKMKRQPILWISFIAMMIGPLMGILFMGILRHPEWAEKTPLLSDKANAMAIEVNWDSYFMVQLQALAVGGTLILGFISAWIFGREYADRTHTLWLSVPTSRSKIITSKLVVLTLWSVLLVSLQILTTVICGQFLGLPAWDPGNLLAWVTGMWTTFILLWFLCFPIAWMASRGRGYMAPLGMLVLAIVFAQLLGVLGLGGWFPWSIPAIHAGMIEQEIHWYQYLLVAVTGLAGMVGLFTWWNQTDQ